MIDFAALDHETRAVALVGHFLQLWASLDGELVAALAAALKLTGVQGYIVGRNISFQYKIHVLGAVCSISNLEDADKEYYKRVLKDINTATWKRNTVAHDLFIPSRENDGV